MKKQYAILIRKTKGNRFTVGNSYIGTLSNGFFTTLNDEYEKVICHEKEFEKYENT